MRKLSSILSEQKQKSVVESIDSKEKFVEFVHEQLKASKGYSETSANMIAESLLNTHHDDFQKAASELENFRMHS